MCEHWEGLGVTREQLTPGALVMVPVGMVSAVVNGGPCVIALAEVVRRADPDVLGAEADDMWWLNVHLGPGVSLRQIYRAKQILGVPAHGLASRELSHAPHTVTGHGDDEGRAG
jgi:hypothetical protein